VECVTNFNYYVKYWVKTTLTLDVNSLILYEMKNPNFLKILSLLLMVMLLPSCDIIGGIFKAGVGTGIFIVVVIIAVILIIIMNSRRNRRAGP